jgi:hypothetical protein
VVRLGWARQGLFELVAVPQIVRARRGTAWHGGAWFGKARCHLVGELRIVPAASESHGEAGHGGERIGTARLCLSEWWHCEIVKVRRGEAWRGQARLGLVRHGQVRWGWARQGHFGAMVAVTANRYGSARRWQGLARLGAAGYGRDLFTHLTGDSET